MKVRIKISCGYTLAIWLLLAQQIGCVCGHPPHAWENPANHTTYIEATVEKEAVTEKTVTVIEKTFIEDGSTVTERTEKTVVKETRKWRSEFDFGLNFFNKKFEIRWKKA